jgi:hypothetical protein
MKLSTAAMQNLGVIIARLTVGHEMPIRVHYDVHLRAIVIEYKTAAMALAPIQLDSCVAEGFTEYIHDTLVKHSTPMPKKGL